MAAAGGEIDITVERIPDGEVSAILIEPKGTVNTGDTPSERTAALQELELDESSS